MQVYFVIPASAAELSGQITVQFSAYGVELESFDNREDADVHARRMASERRGERILVVEGRPVAAFYAEPVSVKEVRVE